MEWIGNIINGLTIDISSYVKISLTLVFILIFFVARKIISRIVRRHGIKYSIEKQRVFYILKIFDVLQLIFLLTIIAIVWDVSVQGLSFYLASIFTVVGIGFFAQWSILSNITASVILFFYYPYEIGSYVTIYEGDNSVTGKVMDITLFSVRLQLDSGDVIAYPNNLAIQKPIIQLKNKPKKPGHGK